IREACTFFFFHAEDGIRDFHVTGVQTCALPISRATKRTPVSDDRVQAQGQAKDSVGVGVGVGVSVCNRQRYRRRHRFVATVYQEIGRASCREREKIYMVERSYSNT